MNSLKKKAFLKLFVNEQLNYLPGQIAFFIVLSLIPIVAIITYIGTMFLPSLDNMVEFMNGFLPKGVSELLLPLVYNNDIRFGFTIFIFSSFLLASNGVNSMITAADKLYGTKNQGWIKQRMKAIIILLLIVILIMFMLIVPILGNKIVGAIDNFHLIDDISHKVKLLYNLLKWPITVFYIYFTVNLMYVMVPSKRVLSETVRTGSLMTTIGWITVTGLFSFYIDSISKYQLFYGSLANLIILMLWIYFLSYIFVVGLIYNVEKNNN